MTNAGSKIIHVDPRYTRTSAIADLYAPIRAGTDVAFFGGLINYILEHKLYHEDYIKLHTNAPFIVGPDFKFEDGMFSGYDEATRTYNPASWDYDRLPPVVPTSTAPSSGGQPVGSSGGAGSLGSSAGAPSGGTAAPAASGVPAPQPVAYAKTDPTLQDPRSVFQLMKAHYSRYTPEKVSEITGMPVEKFTKIGEWFGSTGTADKVGNIVYAVGLTHHVTGVQIIRALGMVQMLLGQHGPARRWRQRRAGSRQHPGEHRQRHQLGDLPRLPGHPQAGHEHHGRLHRPRCRRRRPHRPPSTTSEPTTRSSSCRC